MPPPPLHSNRPFMGSFLSHPPSPPLKRPRAASAPCENEEARQRKRSRANTGLAFMHENTLDEIPPENVSDLNGITPRSKGKQKEPQSDTHNVCPGVTAAVIEDLAQELKCGCCTELCYNPVLVNPCQHFFCGSCCILWVRNGGTNCPACRGVSTTVTPSRVLQSMIDLLLRSDPSKARTASERAQADQVYKIGSSLRLPTPRPVTPDPVLEPPNDNFARPCPTCPAGNPYGWRCPVPIQDPAADPENAFDLDDGTPPGHAFCGNCDQLHNLQAPTSTKCDFCQVSFCGVGIQGRCCALALLSQQPHAMSEIPDIILSGSVYESFHGNFVEVDILVDYLRANDITLRAVYKEIIAHTLQQPNSFMTLIDSGIFDDLHPVSGGDDPDPSSPRRRICRLCAAQLLIHGLKDWWIRERRNGNLPDDVVARKDCPQGNGCDKQNDPAHCKEFNHIIANLAASQADHPPASGSLNALPSIHRAPPHAPPPPFGIFFHPSDIDMPPQSPPAPPPQDNSSFHPLSSSHAPLQSEPEAVVPHNRLAEESNTGGPNDVHSNGLQLHNDAAFNRPTSSSARFGDGESSAAAMMPLLPTGVAVPDTLPVATDLLSHS